MSDEHLFRMARAVSLQSDYCGSARIGCIAVYKGSVLAKGFNTDKTHTIQSRYNVMRYKNSGNRYLPPKAHAELTVAQKIKYLDIDFARVHIYVYRELKDGTLAMSRPCPACYAALKQMGIKHIHYTTDQNSYCHERIL